MYIEIKDCSQLNKVKEFITILNSKLRKANIPSYDVSVTYEDYMIRVVIDGCNGCVTECIYPSNQQGAIDNIIEAHNYIAYGV